ncbi:MAG: peptidyl-dipeptidase Dcp, partial [Polaromonas sp.]
MTNPLLSDWTTEFALPPFAQIKDEDFGPAIDTALADGRARVAAIAECGDAPNFANT